MKRIVVNGKQCEIVPYSEGEPAVGSIIGQWFGRRVYRIVCQDGDDYILRNVRNDDLIVAVSGNEIRDEFGLVRTV